MISEFVKLPYRASIRTWSGTSMQRERWRQRWRISWRTSFTWNIRRMILWGQGARIRPPKDRKVFEQTPQARTSNQNSKILRSYIGNWGCINGWWGEFVGPVWCWWGDNLPGLVPRPAGELLPCRIAIRSSFGLPPVTGLTQVGWWLGDGLFWLQPVKVTPI